MNPKPRTAAVALVAVMAGLAGCTSYPMGLSKAKWDALPPETQARLAQEDAREARQGMERARDELARYAGDWGKADENSRRVAN